MVLGRQASNEDGQVFMEAVELTEDHKPDNPGECRRINEAGGRVDRLVSGTALVFPPILPISKPGSRTFTKIRELSLAGGVSYQVENKKG